MGSDGPSKGPLIFSFKDILNTILIYTCIQKKNCPDKYVVGLYFGQVGELPQRFSKSHYYVDFLKNALKSIFFGKIVKGFPCKK